MDAYIFSIENRDFLYYVHMKNYLLIKMPESTMDQADLVGYNLTPCRRLFSNNSMSCRKFFPLVTPPFRQCWLFV